MFPAISLVEKTSPAVIWNRLSQQEKEKNNNNNNKNYAYCLVNYKIWKMFYSKNLNKCT